MIPRDGYDLLIHKEAYTSGPKAREERFVSLLEAFLMKNF
jgi:hypothetical protein